jgi:hypothetical protein
MSLNARASAAVMSGLPSLSGIPTARSAPWSRLPVLGASLHTGSVPARNPLRSVLPGNKRREPLAPAPAYVPVL